MVIHGSKMDILALARPYSTKASIKVHNCIQMPYELVYWVHRVLKSHKWATFPSQAHIHLDRAIYAPKCKEHLFQGYVAQEGPKVASIGTSPSIETQSSQANRIWPYSHVIDSSDPKVGLGP